MVVEEDTLWDLAQRYFREPRLHFVLSSINDIPDATKLKTGTVLWIPNLGSTRAHEVVAGDQLGKLAQRYYGTSTKWSVVAEANGVKDPQNLRIGQLLWIPDLAIEIKQYKGHLIEVVASKGKGELVIDDDTVPFGQYTDGTYFLDVYAYDPADTLMKVAEKWIDYQADIEDVGTATSIAGG
jgi:hypothetical protein